MFVFVQFSDLHVGATWSGVRAEVGLEHAVAAVSGLEPAPDAFVLSGDLVADGADADYERLRELLAPLTAPIYVLPGNHDDRAAMRRHFDLPGDGRAPINYTAELGPLLLVVLDTTRPGEDAGELDPERLEWLDAELSKAPDAPTVIAMHHPPLDSGLPEMDAISLPVQHRRELAAVLRRHPQVLRLLAGHIHRTLIGNLDSVPVIAAPSTFVQARIQLRSEQVSLIREPPGIAVHVLLDGELVTYAQPVG